MVKKQLALLLFMTFSAAFAQNLSGDDVLNKAIKYHDPDNLWSTFHGQLSISTETPDKTNRLSEIILNLAAEYFELKTTRDNTTTLQLLHKGNCKLSLNGSEEFSEDEAKSHRLNCNRAKTMKNYYTYLYGLPMKLRDPGTNIDPTVSTKKFKGKEYLVIKVTYDEPVGGDIWYFYFDPVSYAMEVYQFYHDESKNDGEYILLKGEEKVSGIKMPKTRAWYYNKDDTYLGTDILTKTKAL